MKLYPRYVHSTKDLIKIYPVKSIYSPINRHSVSLCLKHDLEATKGSLVKWIMLHITKTLPKKKKKASKSIRHLFLKIFSHDDAERKTCISIIKVFRDITVFYQHLKFYEDGFWILCRGILQQEVLQSVIYKIQTNMFFRHLLSRAGFWILNFGFFLSLLIFHCSLFSVSHRDVGDVWL